MSCSVPKGEKMLSDLVGVDWLRQQTGYSKLRGNESAQLGLAKSA
jgi:hypothetical protein